MGVAVLQSYPVPSGKYGSTSELSSSFR